MHPSISLMLNNPRMRGAIERALAARGQHGDTMVAHINPAEALALRQMGGVGTINPATGLRQFFGANPHGGESNSGSGGGGPIGGDGGDGGNGQGGGAYSGTHASGPGYGFGPTGSPSGGYAGDAPGNYGGNVKHALASETTGGININPAGALPVIGGLLGGPFGGLLGYGAKALLGNSLGFNIGGMVGGPPKGGGYGNDGGWGGWGNGGPGHMGPPGQNGGGQSGDPHGMPGAPGGSQGASGTTPAPAVPPAGLPPAMNPALAGLYYGGMTGDPFAGRFGVNPGLLPYLIAANQPQGGGYLNGILR